MNLKMEVAELRTSLDDSRHLSSQYREQTTSLRSKLAAATDERDILSEKLSKYRAKLLQMKTMIDTLKRERTEMRVKLEAAQSEAIECRNRSRQLLQSNENLMSERDSLTGMVISEEERRASADRRVRRTSLLSQVSLGSISLPFTQAGTSPHDSNSTIDSNVLADVAKAFAGTEVQAGITSSASDIPKKGISRRSSRRSSWRRPSLINSLEEETAKSDAAYISAVATSRRRSLMQRRSSEMSLGLGSVAEGADFADEISRLQIEDDELPVTLPTTVVDRTSTCVSKLGDQPPNPLAHKIVDGQNSITLNDIILSRAENDTLQESDGTNKDVIDFLRNASHQLFNAEFYCSEEESATVPSSVAQNNTTCTRLSTNSSGQDPFLPPTGEGVSKNIPASIKKVPAGVLDRVICGLFQERVDTQEPHQTKESEKEEFCHPSGNMSLATRIPRRNSLNSKMA